MPNVTCCLINLVTSLTGSVVCLREGCEWWWNCRWCSESWTDWCYVQGLMTSYWSPVRLGQQNDETIRTLIEPQWPYPFDPYLTDSTWWRCVKETAYRQQMSQLHLYQVSCWSLPVSDATHVIYTRGVGEGHDDLAQVQSGKMTHTNEVHSWFKGDLCSDWN